MQLNIRNWKVQLIRSTYSIKDPGNLPKSLCSFFWVFLSSIILFPIAFWGHICNIKELYEKDERDFKHQYKSGLVNALGVGFVMLAAGGAFGWKLCCTVLSFLHLPTNPGSKNWHDLIIDALSLYYYSFIFFILFAAAIFAIIGIIVLISNVWEHHKEAKEEKRKADYIAKHPEAKDWYHIPKEVTDKEKKTWFVFEYILAVKNKFCPIIEYKK
jgi:hypothetical protein